MIETEDSCGMGGVWSSDVAVGYSAGYFATLYADPVPIRFDGEALEVPEPIQVHEIGELGVEEAWRMVGLMRTDSIYQNEETFSITFCENYQYAWSAMVMDADTIFVTRDGTGCGEGDGQSRICDNSVSIEYALVTACRPPCELIGEGKGAFPEDVILGNGRCVC